MKSRKKLKARLALVETALLHFVVCTSGEKYCESCDLAEKVLLQSKEMRDKEKALPACTKYLSSVL